MKKTAIQTCVITNTPIYKGEEIVFIPLLKNDTNWKRHYSINTFFDPLLPIKGTMGNFNIDNIEKDSGVKYLENKFNGLNIKDIISLSSSHSIIHESKILEKLGFYNLSKMKFNDKTFKKLGFHLEDKKTKLWKNNYLSLSFRIIKTVTTTSIGSNGSGYNNTNYEVRLFTFDNKKPIETFKLNCQPLTNLREKIYHLTGNLIFCKNVENLYFLTDIIKKLDKLSGLFIHKSVYKNLMNKRAKRHSIEIINKEDYNLTYPISKKILKKLGFKKGKHITNSNKYKDLEAFEFSKNGHSINLCYGQIEFNNVNDKKLYQTPKQLIKQWNKKFNEKLDYNLIKNHSHVQEIIKYFQRDLKNINYKDINQMAKINMGTILSSTMNPQTSWERLNQTTEFYSDFLLKYKENKDMSPLFEELKILLNLMVCLNKSLIPSFNNKEYSVKSSYNFLIEESTKIKNKQLN